MEQVCKLALALESIPTLRSWPRFGKNESVLGNKRFSANDLITDGISIASLIADAWPMNISMNCCRKKSKYIFNYANKTNTHKFLAQASTHPLQLMSFFFLSFFWIILDFIHNNDNFCKSWFHIIDKFLYDRMILAIHCYLRTKIVHVTVKFNLSQNYLRFSLFTCI